MTVHLLSSPTTTTFIRYFLFWQQLEECGQLHSLAGDWKTIWNEPSQPPHVGTSDDIAVHCPSVQQQQNGAFFIRRILRSHLLVEVKTKIQFGFLVFCWWWNSRSS
jgi:hypothetical protein